MYDKKESNLFKLFLAHQLLHAVDGQSSSTQQANESRVELGNNYAVGEKTDSHVMQMLPQRSPPALKWQPRIWWPLTMMLAAMPVENITPILAVLLSFSYEFIYICPVIVVCIIGTFPYSVHYIVESFVASSRKGIVAHFIHSYTGFIGYFY